MPHDDAPDINSIDTIEVAAIIISGFVLQGRIGPTNANDYEAETLLAQLAVFVRQQEPRR